MRRREYLRSAVAGLGVAGLATTAPAAAGDTPSSTDVSPSTDTPSAADAADGSPPGDASTGTTPTPTRSPSESADLTPLASLPVTSGADGIQATEAVVTPGGETAFVSKLTGFHAVDVSDPRNPEVVATREDILADRGGPMTNLYDIKYNRGRLLVATEGGSPYRGVALFDVREPADPRLLTAYETGYGIHNCDLHGDYAYLTTGRTLEVVDLGRDDPERVAQWSLTDYDGAYDDVSVSVANLHDMYVQGGRAYLAYWDAGTWILDVSDPADPRHVGHVTVYSAAELADVPGDELAEHALGPPGNDHYVQPNDDGTLLAVGKESWAVPGGDGEGDAGGPSGVALWDIEDPAEPTRLATVDPPSPPEGETASYSGGYWTTAHNFEIAGDYLYSSWYRGGVAVHDISDPADPVELARWADGETASVWTAQVGVPGEFFVASSYQHPTDPDGPGRLYVFPDPSGNAATVTPSGPEATMPGTPTPSAAPSPAPTESGTPTLTPSPTPTATPTVPATPTPTPEGQTGTPARGTTGGEGPGFGPLAALAALGAGAWRLVDGDDGEE